MYLQHEQMFTPTHSMLLWANLICSHHSCSLLPHGKNALENVLSLFVNNLKQCWTSCIFVGDWPSRPFSWSLCLACTTWFLSSCRRTPEKTLATFSNLAWALFRCVQPSIYEIHRILMLICTIFCNITLYMTICVIYMANM